MEASVLMVIGLAWQSCWLVRFVLRTDFMKSSRSMQEQEDSDIQRHGDSFRFHRIMAADCCCI